MASCNCSGCGGLNTPYPGRFVIMIKGAPKSCSPSVVSKMPLASNISRLNDARSTLLKCGVLDVAGRSKRPSISRRASVIFSSSCSYIDIGRSARCGSSSKMFQNLREECACVSSFDLPIGYLLHSHRLPKLRRRLPRPPPKRPNKTLLVLKPRCLRHLLDGPLRAVQQLHCAGAANLVFQALQRGAFFLQLPVQRA